MPTSSTTTPERYDLFTRILHWAMAALILWQLVSMVIKLSFERNEIVSFFVGSHQPVGTVLAILVVLRVIWALKNRGNRPAQEAGLLGQAAKAGHLALYAVMLIVPFAAILRSWGNTRAFQPFGFEIFPAREVEVVWAVKIGDALHGELGWALLALVLGHIAMVVLHTAIWKDGTLSRMTGRG